MAQPTEQVLLPTLVLGRIFDEIFYPINPRYVDDELIFDGFMDIHGADADFVTAVMGNTWVMVAMQDNRAVFAVRGDATALFDGRQTTQATAYPSTGVHELRLIRGDKMLILHYYVSKHGPPPYLKFPR